MLVCSLNEFCLISLTQNDLVSLMLSKSLWRTLKLYKLPGVRKRLEFRVRIVADNRALHASISSCDRSFFNCYLQLAVFNTAS